MKRFIGLAILATILMVGCDKKGEVASQADVATNPVPTDEASQTPKSKNQQLAEPMFDGYEPGFPYHLRSDKTSTDKAGNEVRRITMEYIGVDQDEAEQVISEELAKLGYKGKPPYDRHGMRNMQFVKKGGPRVGVMFPLVTETSQPRAEGARGFVRFVWKPVAEE